ncbi:MAG: SGNH/GDSL hydrolase family protein [Planctomycetota bacterium]
MSQEKKLPPSFPYAAQLCLTLGVICLGLGAAVLVLLLRLPRESAQLAATRALVRYGKGIFDSFPDPSVGRVLQPMLDDEDLNGVAVSTNEYGMREKPYAIPKTPALVRVVLLGDSYVLGEGAEADERFGVFLERFLRERSTGFSGRIECLHLGVISWNIMAECQYLRRNLTNLRPDLVIQVIVPNDLDDMSGVRGFGSMARFSPWFRERANGLVLRHAPGEILEGAPLSFLMEGLDRESQKRYAEAQRCILRLARDIRECGGKYLVLNNFMDHLEHAEKFLLRSLSPDQVTRMPFSFWGDQRYRVSPADSHWNVAGHRYVAMHLYAVIRRCQLLPQLNLQPWSEADAVAEEAETKARAEMANRRQRVPTSSTIDFENLTLSTAQQVYGGIGAGGLIAPYGSLVLKAAGGRRLVLDGQYFDAPQLDANVIEVHVEGHLVTRLQQKRGETFHEEVPLPAGLGSRDFANVCFVAKDYLYTGQFYSDCTVFVLKRIAISP